MLFYFQIVLVSFIAGALDTVVGFAGGLLLLPVLVVMIDSKEAVLLAALIPLGWNIPRLALLWKEVNWRAAGLFALGIIPGALLGANFLNAIDPRLLQTAIGVVLALFGIYYILRLYMELPSPGGLKSWAFPVIGLISGVVGSMLGAGHGPLQVGALASSAMPVREIAATGGVLGSITALARVAGYGMEGMLYPEIWLPSAIGMIGAAAGTMFGIRLSRRAKDATLELLIGIVILLAGIKMML